MKKAQPGRLLFGQIHPDRQPLVYWSLLALSLFALALGVYWPALDSFFALDDFTWLRAAQNTDVAATVKRAFTFPTATPFQRPTPFWRPLVDLYFIAGWRTFGEHPTAWHIFNLVLHATNGLLLAALTWRLTKSSAASALTAALFVVLPNYGFAVTWISSVTELLAAFFFLLVLLLYVTVLQNERRSRWTYIGALIALLLALLTKESTISVFPVLVVLVLVLRPPDTRSDLLARTQELIPFFALTTAYVVFQYSQQYDSASSINLYSFGNHAWFNLWSYLEWLMLPRLHVRGDWVLWVQPVLATILVMTGCVAFLLRHRILSFAFVWILLALIPYLFFPSGAFSRYTYLAAMPLALLWASITIIAAEWLKTRLPAVLLYVGLAIGAALLMLLLGNETRVRQESLERQASLFDRLYHDVPALCGDLPAESTILVLDSPVPDVTNDRVVMTLNLAYADVYVTSSEVATSDTSSAEFDCAVAYDETAEQYSLLG